MLHRLCGPPSIPLSFTLASVLPRRDTYCVSYDTENKSLSPISSVHRLRLGLPGYLILFAPLAFEPQRQYWARRLPSQLVFFRYLRIPPLHLEFHLPLPYSRKAVLKARYRLSRYISLLTYSPAYAPFTPSDSEQR